MSDHVGDVVLCAVFGGATGSLIETLWRSELHGFKGIYACGSLICYIVQSPLLVFLMIPVLEFSVGMLFNRGHSKWHYTGWTIGGQVAFPETLMLAGLASLVCKIYHGGEHAR